VTGARTTKLLFDQAEGLLPKAVGVEFSQGANAASDRLCAQLKEGGEVLMCSGV
jgi:hypothetical protein